MAVAVIGFVIPSALGEHEFITTPFISYPDGWKIFTDDSGMVSSVISPDNLIALLFRPCDNCEAGDEREFVDDEWTLDLMKGDAKNWCMDTKSCSNFNENIGVDDRIYEIDGHRALTIFFTFYTDSEIYPSLTLLASKTNIYGDNFGIVSIMTFAPMDMYAENSYSIEKIIQSYTINDVISISDAADIMTIPSSSSFVGDLLDISDYCMVGEIDWTSNDKITQCDFLGFIDMNYANLSGAQLPHADLFEANLYRADLTNADLTNADLRGADLTFADLAFADLTNADLAFADLTNADLFDADLYTANLHRADLRGADLTNADLTNADLSGADLRGTDLTNTDLSDADLTFANLHRADLTKANLSGANLENTNLKGASLPNKKPTLDTILHLDSIEIRTSFDNPISKTSPYITTNSNVKNYESIESLEPHKNRAVIANYQPLESNWKPAVVPNYASPSKLKLDTSHSSEFRELVNKAKSAPKILEPKPMNDKIYPNKRLDRVVPNIGKDLVLYDKYGDAP